jgi:4-azaleucine resistance transporter AzlC
MTDLHGLPSAERSPIRRAAIGVGLYAGAFGASFGAIATGSGLTVGQTMVLSLVMFSGASQFAFASVATAAGTPFAAVPAALLLGVRNAFYGVPISELFHPRGARRFITAHFVIDETTAMAVGQDQPAAKRYAFWATGLILCTLWQVGTLTGALVGQALDPSALGLDAAAPAIYLALLWPALKRVEARWVAIAGAAVAVVLIPLAPKGVPVIAAAAVALAVGLWPRPTPVSELEETA